MSLREAHGKSYSVWHAGQGVDFGENPPETVDVGRDAVCIAGVADECGR